MENFLVFAIIVLIFAGFIKVLEILRTLCKYANRRIRGLSAEQFKELEDEKHLKEEERKLDKAQKVQALREQVQSERQAIEDKLKGANFGKTFEAVITLIGAVFLIVFMVKMMGYFDASQKQMQESAQQINALNSQIRR